MYYSQVRKLEPSPLHLFLCQEQAWKAIQELSAVQQVYAHVTEFVRDEVNFKDIGDIAASRLLHICGSTVEPSPIDARSRYPINFDDDPGTSTTAVSPSGLGMPPMETREALMKTIDDLKREELHVFASAADLKGQSTTPETTQESFNKKKASLAAGIKEAERKLFALNAAAVISTSRSNPRKRPFEEVTSRTDNRSNPSLSEIRKRRRIISTIREEDRPHPRRKNHD
ncbi:Hypothetical protein D9617_98g039690 [Elsinoe fawcettii]|nr:Hypothetical protein D9617_98g039690 [Elsinoe fawcettii]